MLRNKGRLDNLLQLVVRGDSRLLELELLLVNRHLKIGNFRIRRPKEKKQNILFISSLKHIFFIKEMLYRKL